MKAALPVREASPGGWDPPENMRDTDSFRLGPLITAVRWATTAVSLLLLSTGDVTDEADAVIGAALLSYALWRTVRPLEFSSRRPGELAAILVEGGLIVTAIITTGYWGSPFVFCLVTVISAAGFAGGIPLALQATAACVAAIAIPLHLVDGTASTKLTLQWAAEIALVAMLAGYARHLSLEARAETSKYAGRLRQLAEVNDLLLQLRSAAQTMPMSLDLAETLDSSVDRLQELLEPDAAVLFLYEDGRWLVARAWGVQLSAQLSTDDLPLIVRQASESPAPVVVPLDDPTVATIAPPSRSGVYVRLTARQELIGLVAVERRTGDAFSDRDVAVVAEFCQQLAIGIDNARWFSRIGTLAAEQERSRIARDLHDRVGQSLALVGFELDRAARKGSDPEVTGHLLELRETVRAVVSELRETLYDLRTDVSEERDLTAAMQDFLDRVGQRSGLAVEFDHNVTHRLAVNAEREVWRIAQEAVFNAERHASATSVRVSWVSGDDGAELIVVDDGRGLSPSGHTRPDGYGVLGMQERANAIGAALTFAPTPGGGTTVRLSLSR